MITTHATRRVTIPVGTTTLYGDLSWPIVAGRVHGLVVLAHPNSGSRLNPRHQALAAALNRTGLATLLTDLLTSDEDQWDASAAHARYDVELLAARLQSVVDRIARLEIEVAALPVGILATGSAAAAAVCATVAVAVAAAEPPAGHEPAPPRPGHIDAVVCRSGRPDLATAALPAFGVPALWLVAEHDDEARELHRRAGVAARVVPGTADLVDDRAAVQAVAQLAGDWLVGELDPEPAPFDLPRPAPVSLRA